MAKKRRTLHHSRAFSIALIALSLILLGLHTFAGEHVRVDTTTVLFLLILLLIPYLPWITRIRWGDFEAEIGREEIQEIKDKLDATTTPTKPSPGKSARSDEVESITELAATDPHMALVRIRIAIEERLRSLVGIYVPNAPLPEGKRHLPISEMVRLLHIADVIDGSLAGALNDTIAVANRAAHGETVSGQNLERLIGLGIRLIRALDSLVLDRALSSVSGRRIISQDTVEQKRNARYELVTIAPFSQNPERRTYRLNQAELAEFFDVYDGVAEFVISLREVPKRQPKKP